MIEYRSDFTCDLIDWMGNDQGICQAARVSTIGAASIDTEESAGLINFLMKNRHGSPFEHGTMKFLIEAPIKVFREWHRHRIGWSYNEVSGRYTELAPVFYLPPRHRPMVQVGKPGEYRFVQGDDLQYIRHIWRAKKVAETAWRSYQDNLEDGIAKEIARDDLPVRLFTAMYATANPRSIMSFLSLRTHRPGSTFPSFPMWEIDQVAQQVEEHFATHFPLTYAAFDKNGRVAP